VIVVDDHHDTREGITLGLMSYGAQVESCGSGEEAMRLLDENPAAVLVCDLAMPGEDGMSLIRRVRARTEERGGTIPAAALSASTRVEDRARAILAGFDLHVAKPIDPLELARGVLELRARRTPS